MKLEGERVFPCDDSTGDEFFLYFRGMKLFSCLIYLFTVIAFPDIKKILTDSVLNKGSTIEKRKS